MSPSRRAWRPVWALVGISLVGIGTAGAYLSSRPPEPPVPEDGRMMDRERSDRDRHDAVASLPSEFTAPCTTQVDRRTLTNVQDPETLEPSERTLVAVDQRWVEFESADGLTIPGFLAAPRGGGPHPGIVWVHGGLREQVEPDVVEAIARNGYAVLGVDYRGSSGHGRKLLQHPDIGQKDVADVIAAGRYLADLPEVDGGRMAVAGGSRGAAMAFLAVIREPDLFGAVGAFYPIVDWACALVLLGGSPNRSFTEAFGGTPDQAPEAYIERSPYYLADEIEVPVYMAHGLRDRRPPPTETTKMAAALKGRGVEVAVRFYNGISHGFLQEEEPDSPLWADFFSFLDRQL